MKICETTQIFAGWGRKAPAPLPYLRGNQFQTGPLSILLLPNYGHDLGVILGQTLGTSPLGALQGSRAQTSSMAEEARTQTSAYTE